MLLSRHREARRSKHEMSHISAMSLHLPMPLPHLTGELGRVPHMLEQTDHVPRQPDETDLGRVCY